MGKCPVCASEVEVDRNVSAGELVICGNCAAKLELIETDPVTLIKAPPASPD
jgi:lysine biosynthesis protein LysW